MRKKTKIIIVGTVTTIVLAFNYWQPKLQFNNQKTTELSDADYYFKDVNIKQFNEEGQLLNQLKAEKMEHFKTTDTSTFISPKILFVSHSGEAWQIESSSGRLQHQLNLFKLENDTIIFQSPSLLNESTANKNIIRAQDLLLDLTKKTAATDGSVSIQTERSITHANGMFAEFGLQKIALIADVETQGLPNESK